MFRVLYESTAGQIEFGGGDSKIANLTELSGIGIPDRKYNTIDYTGQPGQKTTDRKDSARIITLAGDLYGGQTELENFLDIVYADGTLYFEFDTQKRRIPCKFYAMSDVKRSAGCDVIPFAVQFIADYPYFLDYEDVVAYVFRLEDLWPNLKGSKNKPIVSLTTVDSGMATRRIKELEFEMGGIRGVYPTLYIENLSESTSSTTWTVTVTLSESDGTERAVIELPDRVYPGETIKFDLKHRQIESTRSGDITNTITDRTFLSDFILKPGYNKITLTCQTSDTLSAWVVYSPEYISTEW